MISETSGGLCCRSLSLRWILPARHPAERDTPGVADHERIQRVLEGRWNARGKRLE
jgi:hypothetical protein